MWREQFVQGQRVVDFAIEIQRVDLVVPRQSLDREAVVLVVSLVQSSGFLGGDVEMFDEVPVDQEGHVVVHLFTLRVQTVVDVEEEDGPVVGGGGGGGWCNVTHG